MMSKAKLLTAEALDNAFFCHIGGRMEPDADGVYKVGLTVSERAIRGHIAALEARIAEMKSPHRCPVCGEWCRALVGEKDGA